jgi:hypothetical protein
MKSIYDDMSIEELNKKLTEQEELLEELEDERSIMLGQSGHHISSTGLVQKYKILLDEAREHISELKALIQCREGK